MIAVIRIVMIYIVIWYFASQLIAWMIAGPDEDKVMDMWVGVFLAPILLAMVMAAFVEQGLEMWMARAGMPITPKENPMDYL